MTKKSSPTLTSTTVGFDRLSVGSVTVPAFVANFNRARQPFAYSYTSQIPRINRATA